MRFISLLQSQSLIINSLLVYAQRFGTAAISLISTPIILNQLGVEDFGIYTLTVGLVALLNFVNWSLSSVTQRYIAYAIGSDKKEQLQSVFVTSFFIHLIYAILLFSGISIIAMFFTTKLLNIPLDRLEVSKYVLILVGFISIVQLISVPFIGLLRAYENFLFLSVFGLANSILKLISAFLLIAIPYDKLVSFSVLIALFEFSLFVALFSFCSRNYSAVTTNVKKISKSLQTEMFGFMSWSMIGALALLGRNQGIAIVLNLFFGVVANAAYGIALQIQSAVGILSQGVISSMSPRIMKSAGSKSMEDMIYYMEAMARFGLLSVSTLAIPFLFNTDLILRLWLSTLPDDTIIFSQLVVLFVLSTSLSAGIQTAFQALGKIKLYNIWVSCILLLNLPLAAVFFWLGYPAFIVLIVSVGLELLAFCVRLILLKKFLDYSILNYLTSFSKRLLLPISITVLCQWLIVLFTTQADLQLIFSILFMFIFFPLLIYSLSLLEFERSRIHQIVQRIMLFQKKKI